MHLLRERMGVTDGGDGGEPGGDLEDLTKEELYERAQEARIPGRSKMTKDELRRALAGAA